MGDIVGNDNEFEPYKRAQRATRQEIMSFPSRTRSEHARSRSFSTRVKYRLIL